MVFPVFAKNVPNGIGPKMEIPNQSSYEKMVLNEVSDI